MVKRSIVMVLIDAIDFILLFSLFDHSSGANDVGMSWRDRGNRDVAICGGHHQRGDTTSSSLRSIGEGEIFFKKKKIKKNKSSGFAFRQEQTQVYFLFMYG